MTNTEDDFKALTTALEAGAWGLLVKCVTEAEGPGASLALLQNVRAGRGEVDLTVRFGQLGVTYSAAYLSQGAASPLFTVTIQYPPAADAPGVVH
jgi:hypothetical protein